MTIRFVTKTVHAYLDYPAALGLLAFPLLLGLGQTNPVAFWLSIAAGLAAFVLTLFTDHHLGAVRLLPYPVHMAADLGVGLIFFAAPLVFGFSGLDAMYYWILGATVVVVIGLHKPETDQALAV